ncbi:hypothetical protein [Pectobacterium phage Nepra]|uniref:Uncharacterized protein n=1 Tax=Pectobacterium phage Nepra TaxID=2163635 RepID=A0A2S1GT63_9CAUD|nr:hypothetical protein HWB59_gp38 [Pectobacterium phage Nepra]AWD92588.1 hypothetical protein [Pectobacterium phage Nepra]
MFRTANNVNEALSEIKAHLFPYDENTVHSLVMMYHNTLLKDLGAREVHLPAGHTMNCEPSRYLDITEIARLLGQQGILVTIEEPEE